MILEKNGLEISEKELELAERYISSMIRKKEDAKYHILYVIDASILLFKMSRVRFWAIEKLSEYEYIQFHVIGPHFKGYDVSKTLQENIEKMGISFHFIIWYKPLNENYRYDLNVKVPYKTCIRYNEMWDEEWTRKEIDLTHSDIVICHHYNDYLKYCDLYDEKERFHYVGHHANPEIFRDLGIKKDIDILISGVTKPKHYPLKYRLLQLITKHQKTTLKKYKIHVHKHPGYHFKLAFESRIQKEYNEMINRSRLCISCTSRHKYRLGKYIEIPMAGGVVVGDLPFEDERFKEFVVEVNMEMSDQEILERMIYMLEHPEIMEKKRQIGMEWAKEHTTENYVEKWMKIMNCQK